MTPGRVGRRALVTPITPNPHLSPVTPQVGYHAGYAGFAGVWASSSGFRVWGLGFRVWYQAGFAGVWASSLSPHASERNVRFIGGGHGDADVSAAHLFRVADLGVRV